MLDKFLWSHGARIKVDTLVDKPVDAGIMGTVDKHNRSNRYAHDHNANVADWNSLGSRNPL
jgi:hypothetical protein